VDENWAWAWNLLKILDEDKSIKLRMISSSSFAGRDSTSPSCSTFCTPFPHKTDLPRTFWLCPAKMKIKPGLS